ncbi:hypothetical protein LSTR_LSTR010562 [Laodelphax striatellus]|uniref:Uncharacterized protein n=1 Tax=Laodelphax striatellus TaxID=195883 RepID=A0A482XK02_LAOST|nr:hypothetical protein LSTR_LSTR010562 [Laodelphax striatellus]
MSERSMLASLYATEKFNSARVIRFIFQRLGASLRVYEVSECHFSGAFSVSSSSLRKEKASSVYVCEFCVNFEMNMRFANSVGRCETHSCLVLRIQNAARSRQMRTRREKAAQRGLACPFVRSTFPFCKSYSRSR